MLPFVPSFIPGLVQIFPCVFVLVVLFAKQLHKYAGIFYLLIGAIVFLASWSNFALAVLGDGAPTFVQTYEANLWLVEASSPIVSTILALFTSAYAGVSIYLIVMFIGALPPTPLVRRLLSVRSELSILGGIVILGHVLRVFDFPANFSSSMFTSVWGDVAGRWMFAATAVIGPLLTACFLVGWITSFPAVRHRMKPRTWKRVQRASAYPFMGLMLAQGFCLAVGHALIGYPWNSALMQNMFAVPTSFLAQFAQQVATAWIYVLLAVLYLVLRVGKAIGAHRRKSAK